MTCRSGRMARVVTVAAVLLVATVAALVSYAHMREVAERAGEQWRAYLLPLSVDGLVVAASMVLLTRRRVGLPGGWLAWCALLGGVGASLAANIAAAEPTATARMVAAWPALAFAVAFELLLQQRRVSVAGPAGESAPAPRPVLDGLPPVGWMDRAPQGDPVGDAPPAGHVPAAPELAIEPTPGEVDVPAVLAFEVEPDTDPAPSGGDLASRIADLVATAQEAGQTPPGRRRLAEALGVTEHAIRTAAVRNGAAPEEAIR